MLPFLLILVLCFEQSVGLKVIRTPKIKREQDFGKSFVSIENARSPPLNNISSCLWMSIEFEDVSEVWSTDGKHFSITFGDVGGKYIAFAGIFIRIEFPQDFFTPENWFFFCFSLDNTSKRLRVFLNSEKIFDSVIKSHLDDFTIEKDFLQHERFAKSGGFVGQLTDLNIWSVILDDDDIKSLHSCRTIAKVPDILNWKNANLVIGPEIMVTEEETHPCNQHVIDDREVMIYTVDVPMVPEKRGVRMCKALGGVMEAPKNEEEMRLLDETFTQTKECYGIWVPIYKTESETWIDDYFESVSYAPWVKGQPNGGKKFEKCAAIFKENDGTGLYDANCDISICIYCTLKDFQHFILKGLCTKKEVQIDNKLVLRLKTLAHGRPVFKGFSSSLIAWDKDLLRWVLSSEITGKVLASLSSESKFPLGEQTWYLESDNVCKDMKTGQPMQLMLSKCGAEEYSCSDGTCIPIEDKCNFVADCWDAGDETICPILSEENMEGYKSNIPDIHMDETGVVVKKQVKISMMITDIESIEEVQSRFTTTFNLMIDWRDARLTWKDLKDDVALNVPSDDQKYLIWFPKIIIANSENGYEVPNDSKSKLRVKKNGTSRMSPRDNIRETALFKGSENSITYFREFNVKLKCTFNLAHYPFDTQTCSVSLKAGNEVRNFIELVGEAVEFTGKEELATFDVLGCQLEVEKEEEIDVKINIILKRQVSQHILGIYLPSLFIMIVAQVKHKPIPCVRLSKFPTRIFNSIEMLA